MAASQNQHTQKIVSLLNSGQLGAAAKAAKTAMKAFPKAPQFPNMAATIAAQSGDPRAAVQFFAKALKLSPGDPGIQENLIQSLVESDQHTKARELISKLVVKRPSSDRLWQLLAVSHMRCNEHAESIDAATKAIAVNASNALAFNLRGISRKSLGYHAEAVVDFRKSHEIKPRDPDPLANMSLPLAELGKPEEAFEACRMALELDPNHRIALFNNAVLLNEHGRIEDAVGVFKRLLEIDPLHAEAWSELVQTQSKEDNLRLEPAIRYAITKTPRKSENQIHLNLALGNCLFQKGDFEGASAALAVSNELAFKTRDVDTRNAQRQLEAIKDRFPKDGTLSTAGDTQSPCPIFIIGQPRSGTTLVEMMVSSRSDVASCGELPFANQLLIELLKNQEEFDPKTFSHSYRSSLPALPSGAEYFVDKMPSNYRYVGFLLSAFPNAPIIHVERDPRDVALSMWRSHFPAGDMDYTSNLEAMARTANIYRKYMNHWKSIAGNRMLTLDYSDIVTDIEGSSRKIADLCEVEWTPEMMSPEQNKARVKTASVVQVRHGVHTKSIGGWQRMERALLPFTKALDHELWPDLD
ncbi:tetratricopeptide repeat-containing sulfotransferase family protein [Pelagimonas sp. KU-00592-HH]|uniref:sulfotransferase n=1 Tax=Pelagimonas sp. KU-00592-HH TaxID=3127651 RepID=UPI0031026B6A